MNPPKAAPAPQASGTKKPKQNTKSFSQQKRRRRQWMTFVRMVRYGVNNFSRNAWLTVAATAVMTITLLIIFTTVAARLTLEATLAKSGEKVSISIYLDKNITDQTAQKLRQDVENLESVAKARYISSAESRMQYAQENKNDAALLESISEATNENPAVLRVNLVDINDTKELEHFVNTNATLKEHLDPAREPSFKGKGKGVIDTIGSWVRVAGNAGLGASVVFIILSSLIVFNTIRMAIFNRKEEIQMMKLIGADKSFIRGPFIVEAMVYGFFAAIVATGLGIGGVLLVDTHLEGFGFVVTPLVQLVTAYSPFVMIGMILLGMIIGVVSSLLATRRYLKIA